MLDMPEAPRAAGHDGHFGRPSVTALRALRVGNLNLDHAPILHGHAHVSSK